MCILSILIYLIFLNQFCSIVLAQTEISRSFFNSFSTDDDWKAYLAQNTNHITNCGISDIFGRRLIFNDQTVIIKTFILPPHYKIYLEFKFWRLNPWFSGYYILYLNGDQVHSYNPYNATGEQICGSGTLGQIDSISKQIDHKGNSAIIIIVSKQNSAFWGISDFKLSVLKCSSLCDYCESDGICLKWFKVIGYFTTLTFTNGQGWKKNNLLDNSVLVCGFQYYGNFLTSQEASIQLNLIEPHSMLTIQFIFFCVEITGSVTISVTGDNLLLCYFENPLTSIVAQNYLCDSNFKKTRIEIFGQTSSSSTMKISIGTPNFVTTSGNTPLFGIRAFEVLTYQSNKIIIVESPIHEYDYILAFEGFFSQQYNCVEGCSNCIRDLCVESFFRLKF